MYKAVLKSSQIDQLPEISISMIKHQNRDFEMQVRLQIFQHLLVYIKN